VASDEKKKKKCLNIATGYQGANLRAPFRGKWKNAAGKCRRARGISEGFFKGVLDFKGNIFIRTNKQKPLARSSRDVTLMKIVASAFERSYRCRALARLSGRLSSASLITQSTYAGIIRGFVPAVC